MSDEKRGIGKSRRRVGDGKLKAGLNGSGKEKLYARLSKERQVMGA